MIWTWTVCRQYSPRRDGERRWDQAYQLLARQDGQRGLPGGQRRDLVAAQARDPPFSACP